MLAIAILIMHRALQACRRTAAGAALLPLAVLCGPADADQIDRFADQSLKFYGLPGIVVGVIRDGKLVDTRVRGNPTVPDSRAGTLHISSTPPAQCS